MPYANKITRTVFFICLLAIVWSPVNVLAQLPFNDGFESGNFITGGWVASGGAQVSTQNPSQGVYCAEGAATWGLLKSIPSITDSMVFVEFDVKASQTNTNCLVFRIRDAGTGTSAGFFLNNLGQVMGVNGPTVPVVLANYAVNQWYKILFELNMNSETYDVYIDGILVANDFNFYTPGFGLPTDFSWSSVASSGSAWIDAVSIFAGVITATNETAAFSKSVFVFPNPVSGILNVEMNYSSPCHASMYGMHGEKIFAKPLNKTDHAIDLGNIASGLYFLNIKNETGTILHSAKIVKQ